MLELSKSNDIKLLKAFADFFYFISEDYYNNKKNTSTNFFSFNKKFSINDLRKEVNFFYIRILDLLNNEDKDDYFIYILAVSFSKVKYLILIDFNDFNINYSGIKNNYFFEIAKNLIPIFSRYSEIELNNFLLFLDDKLKEISEVNYLLKNIYTFSNKKKLILYFIKIIKEIF
ncbi:MAG: hypothetical protein U0457_00005 [Candidatus Sericytochromatia bacterium]